MADINIHADTERLIQSVQFNCDLSDREFAADYTICIYLIRMREYYRWVHDIAPNLALDQSTLMDWVTNKEADWAAMQTTDYLPLNWKGQEYSVFDVQSINTFLRPQGLVYSAGYGRFSKPVFMLAELESFEQNRHYSLTIAGKELARELAAPPATLQGQEILIRSEAITRMVWDLYEEWQWKKPDNAMAEVVNIYDFERRPMRALKRASLDQQELLILHELGELLAEDMLSDAWVKLLSTDNKHQHLFARAVRDYLADCFSTLPGLLAEDNVPALHFYFASLTPMRKAMFPSLARSYQQWRETGAATQTSQGIKQAIVQGQAHWLKIARRLLTDFEQENPERDMSMQAYIEQYAL
ncbi:MAG: Sfum_1244 family protein [Arenicellales bacterium]